MDFKNRVILRINGKTKSYKLTKNIELHNLNPYFYIMKSFKPFPLVEKWLFSVFFSPFFHFLSPANKLKKSFK
jgi:hypothetical protein